MSRKRRIYYVCDICGKEITGNIANTAFTDNRYEYRYDLCSNKCLQAHCSNVEEHKNIERFASDYEFMFEVDIYDDNGITHFANGKYTFDELFYQYDCELDFKIKFKNKHDEELYFKLSDGLGKTMKDNWI